MKRLLGCIRTHALHVCFTRDALRGGSTACVCRSRGSCGGPAAVALWGWHGDLKSTIASLRSPPPIVPGSWGRHGGFCFPTAVTLHSSPPRKDKISQASHRFSVGPCEGEVGRILALSTFPLAPLKLGLVKLPLGRGGLADLAAPVPRAVAFQNRLVSFLHSLGGCG